MRCGSKRLRSCAEETMAVGGELRVSAGGGRLFGHGGSSRRRLGAGGARQVSGRRGDGARGRGGDSRGQARASRTDFHRTKARGNRDCGSWLRFRFPFCTYQKRTTASKTNLVIYITQLSSDAHIQLSSAARAALSSCAEAPEKAFWRAEALQRSILSAAGIHSRSPHKHLSSW